MEKKTWVIILTLALVTIAVACVPATPTLPPSGPTFNMPQATETATKQVVPVSVPVPADGNTNGGFTLPFLGGGEQQYGQLNDISPIAASRLNNGGEGVAFIVTSGIFANRKGVLISSQQANPMVGMLTSDGGSKPQCIRFTDPPATSVDPTLCQNAGANSFKEIAALGDGFTVPALAQQSDIAVMSEPSAWDKLVWFGLGMGTFFVVDSTTGLFRGATSSVAKLSREDVAASRVDENLIRKWQKDGQLTANEAQDLRQAKTAAEVKEILGGARAQHLLLEAAAHKRPFGLVMIGGGSWGFNGQQVTKIEDLLGNPIGEMQRGLNSREFRTTYIYAGPLKFNFGENWVRYGGTPDRIILYNLPGAADRGELAALRNGLPCAQQCLPPPPLCVDPCAQNMIANFQHLAQSQNALAQELAGLRQALQSNVQERLSIGGAVGSPIMAENLTDRAIGASRVVYDQAKQSNPLYQTFVQAYKDAFLSGKPVTAEADARAKQAWEAWDQYAQANLKPQVATTVRQEMGEVADGKVIDGTYRVISDEAKDPSMARPVAITLDGNVNVPLLPASTVPDNLRIDTLLKPSRMEPELVPVAPLAKPALKTMP